MRRLAVFSALLTTLLACSGDDAPAPAATASPHAAPAPTAAPSELRLPVSDPQPFTIVPSESPEQQLEDLTDWAHLPRWLLYDRNAGEVVVVDAGDGARFAQWLGGNRLLVRLGARPGIYDAESGTWSTIELGFDLDVNSSAVASPDGSRIVLERSGSSIALLDMESFTFRTLTLPGRSYLWSPSAEHLLIQEQDDRRHFLLMNPLNPDSPVRIPEQPLASGNLLAVWIDDEHVALAVGNPATILVVSLGGSSPQTVLDQAVGEGQVSFSPAGNHFAVSRSGFQVSDSYTSRLAFYSVEPFGQTAEYDGFAMHERDADAWTSDGSRVVALRDPCSDSETLVLLDIATGKQTDLAPVGTSQLALSPDETLVAYAASTPEAAGLFIVPADGSAPPEAVFQLPGAPAAVSNPEWSPDGRFISFGLGGYDRCP